MEKQLTVQEKSRLERAKAQREAGQNKWIQAKIKEIEAERAHFAGLDVPFEVGAPDVGGAAEMALAIEIVKVLSGLTIREMKNVFDVAEKLVCQTHFVDARLIEAVKATE
jgi:hypothetical protein